MNEINNVLFFLQTLHFRDDLESSLFKNLRSSTNLVLDKESLNHLYKQKVHNELINNTVLVLKSFGVLNGNDNNYHLDKDRLEYFIKLVEVAKAARDYKWPVNRPKPFLYISPPRLINSDLAGDVDDISNLLINLVRSATATISIMSPFTNKEGLRSILAPLKACKNETRMNIYLTANEQDKTMIYNQIRDQIPANMMEHLQIFFCSPELVQEDNLPHAKLLVVDSKRGYLGSANFTRQGLTSRFEVGVELDEQQGKTVDKLLKLLVDNETFVPYKITDYV